MKWLRLSLHIDLRSLALFRILLGVLLICDLFFRLPFLRDFYTDDGVLPRSALIENFENIWTFSVHYMSGEYSVQLLLWMLDLLMATFILVGFKTRFAVFMVWLLTVSMFIRNPIIQSGGEDILRLMLFWAMFIPLNARYSLDRALSKSPTKLTTNTYFSLPGAFFLLQLCYVYTFTGILKLHPIWHSEGTAIYYAVHLDKFATPLSMFLRDRIPFWVLQAMTFSVLFMELVFPFLVLLPIKRSPFRLFVPLVFIIFHLGLFTFMELGTFPWICMIYWTAFLPEKFWNLVARKFMRETNYIQVFYDGTCGFCLKTVRILQEFLILPQLNVVTAQSQPLVYHQMQQENSWVVRSHTSYYTRYAAFLELIKASPFTFLFGLFNFSLFRWIGDHTYKIIANRRISLGVWMEKLKPSSLSLKVSPWKLVIACAAFAIATYWNISMINDGEKLPLFSPVYELGNMLNVDQYWNMFAPYPTREDGWYVIKGQLKNGTTYDIWNDQPVDFRRPEDIGKTYVDSYWQSYLMNIWSKDLSDYRQYFARYLCNRWNKTHDDSHSVRKFKIYFMLNMVPPPGIIPSKTSKEMIWSQTCG